MLVVIVLHHLINLFVHEWIPSIWFLSPTKLTSEEGSSKASMTDPEKSPPHKENWTGILMGASIDWTGILMGASIN